MALRVVRQYVRKWEVHMSVFGGTFSAAFVDRVVEAEAFRTAFDAHLLRLDSDPDVPIEAPRDNVVVFTGIGGQGKSAFSQELERWLRRSSVPTGWGQAPMSVRPLLLTRLDLTGADRFDLEWAVLELRRTAGELGLPLPSFDLALTYWWQLRHGESAFPSLPIRRSMGAHSSGSDVADQLMDTAAAFVEELTNTGLGAGAAVVRLLRRAHGAATARYERRAAEETTYFKPVLESIAEKPGQESLSLIPALLTEELRHPSLNLDERPLWVVFVDNFEIINGARGRPGEVEFQRLVYGLPDLLWVVTGQKSLDWHNAKGPER